MLKQQENKAQLTFKLPDSSYGFTLIKVKRMSLPEQKIVLKFKSDEKVSVAHEEQVSKKLKNLAAEFRTAVRKPNYSGYEVKIKQGITCNNNSPFIAKIKIKSNFFENPLTKQNVIKSLEKAFDDNNEDAKSDYKMKFGY